MTSLRDSVTPTASEHLIGRVKWFNNKAGYGFITVTDGSRSGSDIFVHHSAINVDSQQYKYLIQGEYIEFDLVKTDSEKHEWQASRVSGIRGGKLMCETRRELKISRTEYKTIKTSDENVELTEPKTPRPSQRVPRDAVQESSVPVTRQRTPRVRGEGPRDSDKKQWTLVGKSKEQKSTRTQPVKKTSNKGTTIVTIESK
jgi:cold shock CspA family protein